MLNQIKLNFNKEETQLLSISDNNLDRGGDE